ncbi:MAG: ABC transporter substrate-binding protein [Ectothiorhodospiraceae bacterium]|nr:ABC transporter substrate-binding protein [Chromatiales bacterium]MCP5154538.1 ABC transporter substrate-binding protein [Ectothiorhodospiraceae bacterium]
MRFNYRSVAAAVALGCAVGTTQTALAQETPQRGGILNFVVPSTIPSYDAHRETTFGVIHPMAPFYSLLIRVNPANPASPTDFVCDVCDGTVPEPTDGGTVYTFKIRDGVKFHDGKPLDAYDVKATYDKIIFPPEGVPSSRKAFFSMVDAVEAPDARTVVFKLKYPSGAFVPALATPFNWIYSKKDLDEHGYEWHTKNINGSGPFLFVQEQPGAFVEGKRNPNYHHEGRPYIDGFKAIQAPKMAVNLQAIRGDRAAAQFRGFPPKAVDDLVKALGDKITVQTSDWNCVLLTTINQNRKPFDDARVRRALTLAVDRWGGSQYLSKIAIVKTVGGVAFPNHPLAATSEELQQLAGYYPDLEKSREMARKLLADAGQSNLKFELNNRGVDQPYKVVGTWLIDQWKQVGLDVTQRVQPSGPFYDTLRKKRDFDISMDFNCQSVVNPIADVTKWLGSAGNNFGGYEDPILEELYDNLAREGDPAKQRKILRQYEERALSDQAHLLVTLWWNRITAHRSYFKGWKISPSHYLDQQLDNVWLDKSLM